MDRIAEADVHRRGFAVVTGLGRGLQIVPGIEQAEVAVVQLGLVDRLAAFRSCTRKEDALSDFDEIFASDRNRALSESSVSTCPRPAVRMGSVGGWTPPDGIYVPR